MAGYNGAIEGPASPMKPGMGLARRNRRILARRLSWPQGALTTCERIERANPDLAVAWFPAWKIATPGFDREAGFYAWRRGEDPGWWAPTVERYIRRREAYGADAAALEEALRKF